VSRGSVRKPGSTAPDGRERGPLQVVADRVVTLGLVEPSSEEAVRRGLPPRKPWRHEPGGLPEGSVQLVADREDGLELEAEPSAPQRPKGNLDETSQQWITAPPPPLPTAPGHPRRYDSESERTGTPKLLVFVAPQAQWRHGGVTAQRPMSECAHQRKGLGEDR